MEDRGLIARAKIGDEQAFEELMRHYERPVLALCTRLLGQGGEPEEAAQDVFFRLYKSINKFDEERAIEPWLFRIAWNACLDRLRRRRPQQELTERSAIVDPAPILHELRQAIDRLPDRERAALLLREVDGLTTEEAAAQLGSSAVTVRSQISRARARLRQWIGGRA